MSDRIKQKSQECLKRRNLQSVGCDVGASVGDGDGFDVGPKTKMYSIYMRMNYYYYLCAKHNYAREKLRTYLWLEKPLVSNLDYEST